MPSSVSSRAVPSSALTSSSSRSRPMNEVACCGRLFGISLHRQPALADCARRGRPSRRRAAAANGASVVADLEQLDRLRRRPSCTQWPCDCDAQRASRRAPRAPRASAGSARRAPATSRAPRSAWPGRPPPAAWRRAPRLRRCSRAGSPAPRAGRRAPSAAPAARPARGGRPARSCTASAAASNSSSMPSVLSISRPRQGGSRSRATRSCAAQTSAMAASPIASDSLVLSTTSVSSRARNSLMAGVQAGWGVGESCRRRLSSHACPAAVQAGAGKRASWLSLSVLNGHWR